jgi:hypothetical protein
MQDANQDVTQDVIQNVMQDTLQDAMQDAESLGQRPALGKPGLPVLAGAGPSA